MTTPESQKHPSQARQNARYSEQEPDRSQERTHGDKILRWLWYRLLDLIFFFYPGAVSKVHQQEATEKYWILWRDVEILYNKHAGTLGINGTTSLPHDPKDIESFVKCEIIRIEQKNREHHPSGKGISQSISNPDLAANGQSNLKLLLYFYKILIKDRKKLTRREGDLNILWRDLTFIRTRMLTTNGLLPPQQLPFQLDYCRGEAIRLGDQDNEELQELIIDAAVELDTIDASASQKTTANNRTIRNIVRILTRLNNKRLQRLHEQRINKLMYQTAFSIFLLLSCILLYAHEHVLTPTALSGEKTIMASPEGVTRDRLVDRGSPPQVRQFPGTEATTTDNQPPWLKKVSDSVTELLFLLYTFLVTLLDLCKNYMKINPLFFIFFAGLTGGFLSTVMRLSKGPDSLMPGDDAYYAWYVLTKPVVGAFAAAILYIIVQANFVPNEVFSDDYLQAIIREPVGAKGFAFGCIMGFSERIIMPKVR